MKTKKINKKLTLSKTTIANLEQNEQRAVRGGYWYTEIGGGGECRTFHPICFTKPAILCNTDISVCRCKDTIIT